MSELLDKLTTWRAFTVLVVGDFMLDQLVYGHAERLSPEAPVPVLHVQSIEDRPGGAANVCLDLIAMKARVAALGVCGTDAEAELLRRALGLGGVETAGLIGDASRPTTVKQSLIGLAQHRHPQKMFRVDRESRAPIDGAVLDRLVAEFERFLPTAHAVCIEDYNKGVCTPKLCQRIIAAAKAQGKPVLVDPAAIDDYSKYRGATVITPNRSEAARAVGAETTDLPNADDFAPVAARLLKELELEAIVITLDKCGAMLLERAGSARAMQTGSAKVVPTFARQVYDVTGAGDMVLAALAGARANGMGWEAAVRMANAAAGLEVEVFGVQPIPLERIHRECMLRERVLPGKLRTVEQVQVEAAAARSDGRAVVFTNGCFDVLHAGHLSLLRRAAEQGTRTDGASASDLPGKTNGVHKIQSAANAPPADSLRAFLIVAINSDDSVRRLKGGKDPSRPINNQRDRAELLGGLECVDAVIVFDDDTPERVIRQIRPDVLVKGAEYSMAQVPGAEFVLSTGGRVELLNMVEGKSTTKTVLRIREAQGQVPPPVM